MKNCIYITDSITNAMKAKRVLSEHSIAVNTTKVGANRKSGCIHGIEFDCRYASNVRQILTNSRIKFEEHHGDLS